MKLAQLWTHPRKGTLATLDLLPDRDVSSPREPMQTRHPSLEAGRSPPPPPRSEIRASSSVEIWLEEEVECEEVMPKRREPSPDSSARLRCWCSEDELTPVPVEPCVWGFPHAT